MNGFEILIYIILGISLVLFLFIAMYNKIKTYILKANFIEYEIDENLREKYDLIQKIKKLNKNEEEENVEEKIEELSSFDFERKLSEMENEIVNIKNKDKEYETLIYKLSNVNLKISSNKNYFNGTISKYNDFISKLPTKILAKLLKYKEKNYFDDKNLYDENKKDFKI